jgi:phosphatidylglycerol---prolipoprotein diacylglyceryl transferase
MYAIIIFSAILLAVFIGEYLVKRQQLSVDTFWAGVFWALFFGLIGARIYHVLDYFDLYFQEPLRILYIWHGGLGIYGAIFGGLFGAVLYLRYKKERVWPWLDIVAVIMPLAQTIGRFGNYFNNEILPYAFYESGANFILFLIIFFVYFYTHSNSKKQPSRHIPGIVFFMYLAGYALIRFLLEPLHSNSWYIEQVNVARLISVTVLIVSLTGIFWLYRKTLHKEVN